MVLWLSAALAAIVFSLAHTVRGETERSAVSLDGVRSYYLAAGAIERAMLYMGWSGYASAAGTPRFWASDVPDRRFDFPSGEARVAFIPESAKLNVNAAEPEELNRLLIALGTDPERARTITGGIVDWRAPSPEGPTAFDQYYLSLTPSFRARHASFEETEEVLLIKGMTPELYYGSFERDPEGRLRPRPGLRDCLSVYAGGGVDVNTAEPAVLIAIGLSPDVVAMLAERRRRAPFRSYDELQALGQGPLAGRLRIGGNRIYTLRATARLRLAGGRLSDLRRSVAAVVALPKAGQPGMRTLRWYEDVWAQ